MPINETVMKKKGITAMLKSECYVNQKVSKAALNRFFASFVKGRDEVHTLEIYHNDDMLVRIAPAPYSASDKREIYSLSKSFCSTAIGFLCDEGKLSTEDRIVDLFPDKLPENVSENLSKMRVKHVLSMNTGHASCRMGRMFGAEDAVKAFLAEDVPFEPGTHFAYNTGATCMLSAIAEHISGMKLLDFLTWKLFLPLGISGVRWNATDDGTNEGGCGVHVSCDDIVKLGLLYLHGGVYKGHRLLSEEWCRTATSPISDNSMNGSPDWCAGYGYQFWCNAREGFRGDGAFGQLCFVLPKHDMVFAVQTELGDMQHEVDALTELADHLFDTDDVREVLLPKYLPCGSEKKLSGLENICYQLDKNPMGWTGAYFLYDPEADATGVFLSNGIDQYEIKAGNGYFIENTIVSPAFKPKLLDIMSSARAERCRIAASCRAEDGQLTFAVRYKNCPHRGTFTFSLDGDTLTMKFDIPDRLIPEARVITGHRLA